MPTVFNSALAPYPALGSRLRRLPRTATSSCLRRLGHPSARTSSALASPCSCLRQLGHVSARTSSALASPCSCLRQLGHVSARTSSALASPCSCLRQLGHVSARTSIQHSLGHVAIGLFQIVVSTDVEPVLANQVSSDDLAPAHERPNHFRGVEVLPCRDQVDGQRVEHID